MLKVVKLTESFWIRGYLIFFNFCELKNVEKEEIIRPFYETLSLLQISSP